MTDIASLGLRVESGQVTQANAALDKFEQNAAKAEQAADKLGKSTGESGKKFDDLQDFLAQTKQQLAGMKDRLDNLGSTQQRTGQKTELLTQKVRNALQTIVGFDGRTRAITTLFGSLPLRITAAAAAVGVLAKAYADGAREGERMAQAIARTGDAAGVTVGQLTLVAQRLDKIGGTQASATKALATLIEAGVAGSESLERFAATAQKAEKAIGIPLEDIAKNFGALAKAPTEAATEIQKSFNFLTPAVLKYISEQEKAGNVTKAAAAAQAVYDAALRRSSDAVEEHVGILVRGARAVKSVWDDAWDGILGIGRKKTDEERLKELQDLRRIQNRDLGSDVTRDGRVLIQTQNDEEERRLQKIVEANNEAAKSRRQANEEFKAYQEQLKAFSDNAAEFEAAQKQINAAWTQVNLADIDRSLSLSLAKQDAALNELEDQRRARLISEEAYFDKRRELVQKSAADQIAAIRAQSAELTRAAAKDGQSATEIIATQNKIAENAARIKEIRISSADEIRSIDAEQAQGWRDIQIAIDDARASAERYVQTLAKRRRSELDGMGLGDRERQRRSDRSDLEEEFEGRKQQLDRDLRLKRISQKEYDELIKIEEDALQRSLADYDAYYEELGQKQSDWRVGASEAIHNFIDDARDAAGQFEGLFTRAFDGMTDALVDFAMTGKSSSGDLAKSILADLLKIELKVALSNILGAIFGSFGNGGGSDRGVLGTLKPDGGLSIPFGGGRANGGPVTKGVTYLVNENTPKSELFTAPADGWVGPAGGGITVINHNTFGAGANRAELEADLDRRDALILAQVRGEKIRNWRN